MGGTNDISAREIAQLLRADAERLCWHLFPNGRKAAGLFCIGSVNGEPGKSLKVRLSGAKAGTWADYSRSPGEEGGMGDMLTLLQLALGLQIGEAVREAKRWLNLDSIDPNALERQRERAKLAQEKAEQRHEAEQDKRRRDADRLWRSGSPLVASSPPVRYLEARGIDFAKLGRLPGAVRFKPDMIHAELGRHRPVPAMLTRGTMLDGTAACCHVTYLERLPNGTWTKLRGVESSKIIRGPYWGAHFPIWKGEQAHRKLADIKPGTPIEVSEGLEDALSFAMASPASRIVMAGTLGNIGQLALPPQAGQLNVLAQRDEKPEPQQTLEDAIAKQQAAGRRDGSNRVVACRWPPAGINDWNDWLRADAAGESGA